MNWLGTLFTGMPDHLIWQDGNTCLKTEAKEDVLNALIAYQNEDGGFGHGLEPDYWNPDSSPIQTEVATEIIKEIKLKDKNYPIIQGILNYLSSGKDFDGHTWSFTVAANNDYPHAPWWHFESYQETSYNPTASLIGFILKFGDNNSQLFDLACKGTKHMEILNAEQLPEEFLWNDSVGLVTKSLGAAAGSQKIYVNIDYVPPKAYSTKYHSHSQQEEFFMILSGSGTLRLNDKEWFVKQGDFIAKPAAQEIAHTFYNSGNDSLVILDVGTNEKEDTCYYPDEDMYLQKSNDQRRIFRGKDLDSLWTSESNLTK